MTTTPQVKPATPYMCIGCGDILPSKTARCPHCVGGNPGREKASGIIQQSIDDLIAEHAGKAEPKAKCVKVGKASGKASAAKREWAMAAGGPLFKETT